MSVADLPNNAAIRFIVLCGYFALNSSNLNASFL